MGRSHSPAASRLLLALGTFMALLVAAACGDDDPVPPSAPAISAPAATPTSSATSEPITAPTSSATSQPTSTPTPVPTSAPAATAAPTPTATPNPTPSLTPTAVPTPTPTPRPLTAAEIFARVSPSVAFVDTPSATGSGVLIEGGYVLTNAHVIWPFQQVRVVFPDGTEHFDAPVVSWDLLGDLAVIGPLQTALEPLALVDGEDLIIGSDVFLIGYPGELEGFPLPSITRGLISRVREWEPIEMTYFQTDAAIAGGQSGGVLVSEDAEVIGISGFTFTEAAFGLVASGTDVLPRARRLIAGEDVANLGDRRLPTGGGPRKHTIMLRNIWDVRMYVIHEPRGTAIDVELASENDSEFAIVDQIGNELIHVDDRLTGIESGSAKVDIGVPHFLIIGQNSESPGELLVNSSRDLAPFRDPDDGKRVAVGSRLAASMDHPADLDYFPIELTEGDTVEITVDSVLIDPLLFVDFVGATEEQVATDDDSGGGLFGLNAKLVYRAHHTGSYLIAVHDATLSAVGGYILTVAQAPPRAVAINPPVELEAGPALPVAPAPTATAQLDLSGAVLNLQDFPAGFEMVPPAELGFAPGTPIGGTGTVQSSFAFASTLPFQVVFGFTLLIPDTTIERIGFDAALREPRFLLDSLAAGLGQEGATIVEVDELPGTADIGEISSGLTLTFEQAGLAFRMDMTVFRRGSVAGWTASMYLADSSSAVAVGDLAAIFDRRVSEALSAPTPEPVPIATPVAVPTAAPAATATASPAGGVFRRLWSDPPTLDPHLVSDSTSAFVVVEVFSRVDLYHLAEQTIVNDAPWLPLWNTAERHVLIMPHVKGYVVTPMIVPKLRYVSFER